MMWKVGTFYGNLVTVPTWKSYNWLTMSVNDEFSLNCGGVIAVCRKTRRTAMSNSPPADGGGIDSDFK